MYRLIVDLARRGSAIILITDELPELKGLADRIMVMRNGRITHEFAKGDVSEEQLLAAILGHIPEQTSKDLSSGE
jgi:ribose transport system ATP-binding protein